MGCSKQIIGALQSHSEGDVSSQYGRDELGIGYELALLKKEIERFDFTNL